MCAKAWKPMIVIAAALALLLSWQALAIAQAPTGEGPFDAMAPTGEWRTLEEGDYDWYVIHFDYDEDATNRPLEIKMFADPYASATLTVRNQDQVNEWIRDGEQPHFGCCTMVDTDLDKDGNPDFAQWAGSLRESGDYYLVVEHAKGMDETANYRFTVSGENISYPTKTEISEMAAPAKVAAPAQMAAAAEMTVKTEVLPVVLEGLAGSAPDYALTPTGAWTQLTPNQYHWYAFDFDYDKDIEEPMTIRLYADPPESTTLTVRNAEQARLWREEGEHNHFGCCTMVDEDKNKDGYADYSTWSGSLRESGRYFIVLEHAEDMTEPGFYRFTVSGENFSFPQVNEATMATMVQQPEEVVAVADAAPAVEADLIGAGPDFAMEPTEEWVELGSGGYHWYKFTFDEDDEWTKPVTIRLFTDPIDNATLTVRNGEQAELWRLEGEHEHFGCCVRPEVTTQVKADKEDDKKDVLVDETEKLDYAIWSADLTESGVYYLVVEHAKNSAEPAFYRFEMEGDGLS